MSNSISKIFSSVCLNLNIELVRYRYIQKIDIIYFVHYLTLSCSCLESKNNRNLIWGLLIFKKQLIFIPAATILCQMLMATNEFSNLKANYYFLLLFYSLLRSKFQYLFNSKPALLELSSLFYYLMISITFCFFSINLLSLIICLVF